jgi:hypothetical protein
MVCRVLSKNTITIAAKSRMFIPVNIQSSEHLADLGLVDEISKQGHLGKYCKLNSSTGSLHCLE